MGAYRRDAISNGIPEEQELIRRWWHEECGAKGKLVWEYYLEGSYADAFWFFEDESIGSENAGIATAKLHPIADKNVVLCEAKSGLNPEVIGQAIVYERLARSAGANVARVIVFCQSGSEPMQRVAKELGLEVVIHQL